MLFISNLEYTTILIVPDYVKSGRDVVFVKRTIDLGKPRGVGKLEWRGNGEGMGTEWGGEGQFTSNLGPGWTGLHQTRGGIPSK